MKTKLARVGALAVFGAGLSLAAWGGTFPLWLLTWAGIGMAITLVGVWREPEDVGDILVILVWMGLDVGVVGALANQAPEVSRGTLDDVVLWGRQLAYVATWLILLGVPGTFVVDVLGGLVAGRDGKGNKDNEVT